MSISIKFTHKFFRVTIELKKIYIKIKYWTNFEVAYFQIVIFGSQIFRC